MSEHLIAIDDARADLLSCAAFLAETITSRDGHASAMAAVVPRYLAKNDVDLAAELANTVDDPFTRDKLLMIVAEKCAELDDDEYALQLAEAIEEPALQLQARERVAIRKAAGGNIDAAKRIAAEVPHPDAVYAAIAVNQAAEGDLQAAGESLSRVEFAGGKVRAMLDIAAENSEFAADMLEAAVSAAEHIEHKEERIRAFCDIGNSMAEAGLNGRAIEIFGKARISAESLGNVHSDAFLATIAVGFMRAGNTELADRTLDLVGDKTQIASALLGFARELWKKEEKEDAVESLEESYAILRSQKDAETRNTPAKFALFSAISAQFAGFEEAERAIETALENDDGDQQMNALAQIAQITALQHSNDLSDKAVDAIAEPANRVFAMIGVCDAHEKNGDGELALARLDEAFALIDGVPQLASKTSAYTEASTRYYNAGRTETARIAAGLALRTISAVRDESHRTAALASLADLYQQTGFSLDDADKEILAALVNATLL